MFTKALIVACIFAANSHADDKPAKGSFESLADSETCTIRGYNRICHVDNNMCCEPLSCLDDPTLPGVYRCRVACETDDDCEQHEEAYGKMACFEGGQCRKAMAEEFAQ